METLMGLECIPTKRIADLESPAIHGLGEVKPNDLYDLITNRIIETIQTDKALIWQKPWTLKVESGIYACNYETKRPYRGINATLINLYYAPQRNWKSPYFLTFKQIQDKGGKIKKGAKSIEIFYFNILTKKGAQRITENVYIEYFQRCAQGKVMENGVDVCTELKKHMILKYYNVFNADDIEGIDFKTPKVMAPASEGEKIEVCESIVSHYPAPAPTIVFKEPDKAYYRRSQDIVNMPKMSAFGSPQKYYSTLFHELVHSTGNPDRLSRTMGKTFGDKHYALEELVAELGASYLNAESGILYFNLKNSAAYLKGWKDGLLKYMKEDNKFFFSATSLAQKAVDYILQVNDEGIPLYRKEIGPVPDDDRTRLLKLKAKGLKLKLKLLN